MLLLTSKNSGKRSSAFTLGGVTGAADVMGEGGVTGESGVVGADGAGGDTAASAGAGIGGRADARAFATGASLRAR